MFLIGITAVALHKFLLVLYLQYCVFAILGTTPAVCLVYLLLRITMNDG